jgi:acetamidase/formamidase
MATHHTLTSQPDNIQWGAFGADLPPVLTIDDGDSVTIETISGSDKQVPDDARDQMLPDHRELLATRSWIMPGHILTGPIAVRGAQPGDVLEVHIGDIELRQDWAWNAIEPLRGTLPEDFPERRLMKLPLDREKRVGKLPWGVDLPLAPFFGVMGVAPPANWGTITSIVPRAHGGNLDVKEFTAGTTLYFPVFVDGANFSCGDGHAVQGDGEVCLSAAETALTGTFAFRVRKDLAHTLPRAETDTHYITLAFDPDLDDAAKTALREMIKLIRERSNLSAEDAYSLCSFAADVRISQLVNQHKGCHCMLPKAALHG